jgi:hypothetical protein
MVSIKRVLLSHLVSVMGRKKYPDIKFTIMIIIWTDQKAAQSVILYGLKCCILSVSIVSCGYVRWGILLELASITL